MYGKCFGNVGRSMRLRLGITRRNISDTGPIALEMLDVDLFRSKSLWRPSFARAVYGGQVVGQALAASTECIKDDKELHSLHSYFLKGGDPDKPILYRVQRINSTNNFENHSITARQNGQIIFSCQASYHRPEKSNLFHERSMPDAPPPDTLTSQETLLGNLVGDPRIPEQSQAAIKEALKTPFAIDVREVNPIDIFNPEKREPRKLVWMKTRIDLDPNDANLHRCYAAFASDWGLASASLLPHGLHFSHPKVKILTSLDHSMWFHAPFRADEWMLLDMHSVKLSHGRGMNIGYIYNSKGELAITASQEALIRTKDKKE